MPGLLIAVLIAAVAVAFGLVANGFDHRAIHWGRVAATALLALPPALGAALLLVRRLRPLAIAYTAAIGTAGFLALVVPAGLLLIFLGVQTPEQHIDTAVHVAFTLAMLVAAILGWVAHLRQPREVRRARLLVLIAIGAAAYAIVVGLTADKAMRRPYDKAALIRDYNDRQARSILIEISNCAQRHASTRAGKSYPASMAALADAGCLPRQVERGRPTSAAGDGYGFYYYADPPDREGKVGRFVACARAGREDLGTLTIGIDSEGVLGVAKGAAFSPVHSCFTAWAGDDERGFVRALNACVISGSTSRPGRGYPSHFGVGPDDSSAACEVRILGRGPGGRFETERGIVEYVAQPAVAGVISGYRLRLYGKSGTMLEADSAGAVTEEKSTGVPLTLDALQTARPAAEMVEQQRATRRAELIAQCEQGDLRICEDLGDFEWDSDRPKDANRWWGQACERGRLTSCLLSSRYNPTTDPSAARVDKERCRREGEDRYCRRLEQEAELMRPRIEDLRQRGGMQGSADSPDRIEQARRRLTPLCEDGNLELCENLGDLEWDTGRQAQARRWWDRACEGGRLQACLLDSSYNPIPGSQQARQLRSMCSQGNAQSCGELEALIRKSRPEIQALIAAKQKQGGK